MDTKQEIIREYLGGDINLTALERKHGISRRTITRWIIDHQGFLPPGKFTVESSRLMEMKKKFRKDIPEEVAELQKQLEQERLRNKLLNAMIDIAEKELKIPIRKKSGTKQSSK
ncbi:helix-turn-helix domain-containing protein [Flavitalea sp.]|jgi:transposase-like protein|nr:helix-turn-helix domain-containing protein [Flavitalea sp.]